MIMSFYALKNLRLSRILAKKYVRHSSGSSTEADPYELVYSFPYARVGSAINALKLKQSVITTLMCPVSYALEVQNMCAPTTSIACISVAVGANIAFYSIGQLFYKLIGKVYWNESEQIVKLSYIGFFGKREEMEVPLESVTPTSDKTPGWFYTEIEISEPKCKLKVNEQYYDYCNFELARSIFGEGFARIK